MWKRLRQTAGGLGMLVGLLGCAASTPHVTPQPIPDDIGWTRPAVVESEPSTPLRHARPASPREQVFAYAPGDEYRVDVAVGTPLDIWLEPGERRDQIIAGDRRPLQPGDEQPPWDLKEGVSGSGAQARDHVFLIVTKPGLSQGLVITTDRRTYHLRARSVATSQKRIVRWTYPEEAPRVAEKPSLLPDPAVPQRYHVGYTIEALGPVPSWLPRENDIVDDGRRTFLMFPRNLVAMEAPLVRLLGAQGPELANVRLIDHVMIIDHLVHGLELRIGAGDTAEVVRVVRGQPRTITCPGAEECPRWPSTQVAAR